jgi:hypothetical protein
MSDFKIVQLLNPIQINVPINPTGVYSAATTYGIGDSVSYGNSSYICILASTGNVPTNTTYWQLLASSSTNKLETVVRNNLGFTVPSGTAVYLSGNIGNVPLIALSQANTELTSTKTIGITSAPIANNTNGTIVVFGLAENLNTSSFAVGSALWLSPTVAGGLTVTKPSAPDHMVFIGVVTRSHPTQGTIEIKIQNGFELEELHNVAISSVADNQVLKYDLPNLLWKNETLVKGDVGLGSVDNTSDIDKPISTATQTALNLKIDSTLIGAVNGVASLDISGKVPVSQLPNSIMEYKGSYNAATNTPTLVDGTGNTGDVYKTSVAGAGVNSLNFVVSDYAVYNGTSWEKVHSGADVVISVNGYAGAVVLTKSDFGLSNVDNTSDVNKPVSTAQQTAIDAKVANNLTASTTVAPSKTAVNTALGLKVAKAGDTMTGTLTITGNNGVEFGGILVNNTNTAGYCAINARADDGEVIQIAALNSGGAGNAYGMWSANEFGLYSKRSLNILTDTAGAEIKFATGTGATEVAKIDSAGKFSSNGISLNSGTVENVPTPVANTDAANKQYVDVQSIVNALIFG